MFQTGQKIGPYLLERTLGEGSYGVVWLAEERTGLIHRQVALKLPKETDPDIEAVRREAEVWLRAGKHQNVVQVLNADIYDGQVAIATEYIEGGSLHDRARRDPKATANLVFAVEMTRGILAGLQHLHALPPRPLVHRDLKPANVLLRGDTPLLTDFGLSRAFSSSAFTQAGGTPAYMPPESFDDRFSPQTDIWAAGVTLYRMLKGELPFPQRDLTALIGAILNREPEPLPGYVPSAVAAVIFRALMKDPDRRFASADEMQAALDVALLADARFVAVPSTLLQPIPPLPNAPIAPYDISPPQPEPLALYDITPSQPEPSPRPVSPGIPAWLVRQHGGYLPQAGPIGQPAAASPPDRSSQPADSPPPARRQSLSPQGAPGPPAWPPDRSSVGAAEAAGARYRRHLARETAEAPLDPTEATEERPTILARRPANGLMLPSLSPAHERRGESLPAVNAAMQSGHFLASARLRRGESESEALTVVPESAEKQGLLARIDDLLRYLSRDTARFCGTLVAAAPFWGVLGSLGRFLERSQIVGALPGLFIAAGLMSVLFARLAWHRHYKLPEPRRRSAAIRYAVLGGFSGAVVPVIVVAFIVAISGAMSDPSPAPDDATAAPRIAPPAS